MSITYKPKKKKRSKTHGFLARKKKGQTKTLSARRSKGRKKISTI